MIKLKPHLKDLLRYSSAKESRRKYLRLDINEGLPGLPEDFLKKVLSEVDSDFLSTYPEYTILRKKIALFNNLRPENICLSNGSDAVIKYVFDAYVSSGDKVLLTDPTFEMYPVYCAMFAAQSIVIEYKPDFSFPLEEFMQKISKEVKMAILVNPNNPTGSLIEQDELIGIIEKAADNDVIVLVDEAYFYYCPLTVIEEINNFDNLIVLRTFSKLCGMAAARLGYAAACPMLIEGLGKVKHPYDVNGLAVLLAERLIDRPDIIRNLINSFSEGKRYLTKKLEEEDIEYTGGHANFILIKCKGRVNEIIERLFKENILIKGNFKQSFLKDYIRVTVGKKIYMENFWEVFIKIWRGFC